MARARTEGKGIEFPNTLQTFGRESVRAGLISAPRAHGAQGAKCGGCAGWHEDGAQTGGHGTGRDYTRRHARHKVQRGGQPPHP